MTVKADIIAAIKAAADAYYAADPITGAAVKIAIGSPGTKVTIAEQEFLSGAGWENEPKVIPTQIEGLSVYLTAYKIKINEICNQYNQLLADYNSGTVPSSATPISPL